MSRPEVEKLDSERAAPDRLEHQRRVSMSRVTIKVDALVDGDSGPKEAAKLLDKGIATIWRWIRDDKLIAVRIGGRILILSQEIERLKRGPSQSG